MTWGSFWKGLGLATPIIGDIIRADDAEKEKARNDKIAGLDADTAGKEAKIQKEQYEADARQAQLDYGNTETQYNETLTNKTLSDQAFDQKINQRNVEGRKTIGTQTALMAATGQLGTGSATAVNTESETNLSGDLSQLSETKSLEGKILEDKAAGYQTAMTLLEEQRDASQDSADAIDPDAVEADYLAAYTG